MPTSRPAGIGNGRRIASALRTSVLGHVTTEPIAEPLWMGPDVADTIAFLEATGIRSSLL